MRKALTYILFFTLWLNTTSLNQLTKLPTLISHYLEHQHIKKDLSLFQFIAMHYWGNDDNDDDNERDMQLPYKKIDVNTFQGFTLPPAKTVVVKQTLTFEKHTYPITKKSLWVNPTLSSLFRPPKA